MHLTNQISCAIINNSFSQYLLMLLLILVCGKWFLLILSIYPTRLILKFTKNKKTIQSKLTDNCVPSNKKKYRSIINYIYGYLSYSILQVGNIPSHTIRNFLYRKIYHINMGKKGIIYRHAEIRASYKLHIGEGSIIGDHAILDARYGIYIGKNVNLSSNVSIWTDQHDHRDPWFRCNPDMLGSVVIEDRAWLGPGVIVLTNTTIGEGAVVAAGSVVTKNIAPFSIVGGIPAKEIGKRSKDLRYEFNGERMHFN